MTGYDLEVTSESVEQTLTLGRRIGRLLTPGACVGLIGPLGAGKTQLVKGMAEGVGVAGDVVVNSPTFVIVNEYPGRMPLYHLDAYRLGSPAELTALGFEEMLRSEGAVVVEWADRVGSVMPPDHLCVHLDHAGAHTRRIRLRGLGPVSRSMAAALSTSS